MKFVQEHPIITATIAICCLLFVVITGMRPENPPEAFQKIMDSHFERLTSQAREVAAPLPDGTKVVVLILESEVTPSTEKLFKRIYKAIEAEGVSIVHIEPLVFSVEGGWLTESPGFPYTEYLRVAGDHSDAGAVISLCGTPYGLNEEDRSATSSLPKLLVAR